MTLQRSANVGTPGLVNFITPVAYHFCPSTPAAFTQPGASTLANLCIAALVWMFGLHGIIINAAVSLSLSIQHTSRDRWRERCQIRECRMQCRLAVWWAQWSASASRNLFYKPTGAPGIGALHKMAACVRACEERNHQTKTRRCLRQRQLEGTAVHAARISEKLGGSRVVNSPTLSIQ